MNINEIDNDLDLLIANNFQEIDNIQQEKIKKYQNDFQEKKEIFNKWLGPEFDKKKTGEYVEELLTNQKYQKIQSFYKNIKKNIKENIKLLGYVLEEKNLADFKNELWDKLPSSLVIGIKKGKENEVVDFLLNDNKLKEFINENKKHNEKELLNINLRVPEFYKNLYQSINNKQLSNSFFEKDDNEVEKILEKAGINYEGFEVDYKNKSGSIYLSLLKEIELLYTNFNKIKLIVQYIIEYKVLENDEKIHFEEIKDKLKKILKKVDSLKEFEEFDYYNNWLFNPYFDKWVINSKYNNIVPPMSKTFTTKIWNIFKSYLTELDEINNLVIQSNFTNKLDGMKNYIFTNNGVFQNFLDITSYKTFVKQLLLSGYIYKGDKLINSEDLKEITNKILLEDYHISKEYITLTLGFEFITDDEYNFVKEYTNQDDLLQKANSLIKMNNLIKQIDNNVINYIKAFFFEYIKTSEQVELYSNPGVTKILNEKKILPIRLFNDLEKRFASLKQQIISIDKDVYVDKLNKKYIYTIKMSSGIIKFTLNFKKDILLNFKSDISMNDLSLVKENLLYYINNNFPKLVEFLKEENLLLSNFIKTKLDSVYFYNPDYDLSGFINQNKSILDRIQYFYETYGYNITNIVDFIKNRTKINDYIIMSLVSKDLIYIYKKKII